ncbi:hypothetical protein FHG87_021355 [Trinorchestia longiramus]|nr:hypothetical protein FHG87_021355 [Trinorchestia longiramus]
MDISITCAHLSHFQALQSRKRTTNTNILYSAARGGKGQQGAARGSKGQQGAARSSKEQQGAAKSSKEQQGAASGRGQCRTNQRDASSKQIHFILLYHAAHNHIRISGYPTSHTVCFSPVNRCLTAVEWCVVIRAQDCCITQHSTTASLDSELNSFSDDSTSSSSSSSTTTTTTGSRNTASAAAPAPATAVAV